MSKGINIEDLPPALQAQAREQLAAQSRLCAAPKPAVPEYVPPGGEARRNPRGQHKTGVMNKTEAAYAQHLDRLKALGEVHWWSFEAVVFQLAERCTYRPDFMVMRADGLIELHETKGHMEDDAAAKIRVCSKSFPFPIFVIKRDGSEWVKKQW